MLIYSSEYWLVFFVSNAKLTLTNSSTIFKDLNFLFAFAVIKWTRCTPVCGKYTSWLVYWANQFSPYTQSTDHMSRERSRFSR